MRTLGIIDHDRFWFEPLLMRSDLCIGVLPKDEQAITQAGAQASRPVSRDMAASILKVPEIDARAHFHQRP